jgi:hypothetical protein
MTKFKLSFQVIETYKAPLQLKSSKTHKKIIAKNLDTKEKTIIGAYASERRWYRPADSRSRLLTKQRTFYDVTWDSGGLSHIFGQKVSVGKYGDIGDFYNSYDSFTLKNFCIYLNELAQSKGVNLRFE